MLLRVPGGQDGMVSFDELKDVMSSFSMGLPDEAIASLTKQLLRGQDAMRTSELLDMSNVLRLERKALPRSELLCRVPRAMH